MKRLVLLLALAASVAAGAQTRDLLRKSIGGAVELPEPAGADFGLPSWVNFRKVDSLIFRSDSLAELVISNYRRYDLKEQGTFQNRYRSALRNDKYLHRNLSADSVRRLLELRFGKEETKDVKIIGLQADRPTSRKRREPARVTPRQNGAAVSSTQAPPAPVRAEAEAPGRVPLFAGGTALFALGLCAGIVGLYRRTGSSS
ncbi:hypothetical protein [Flaviaesturariibacter aridisoli]|uniref:Uncharacterized protein n=1 Tax=Flaviaesturariibacter aridisoli TaxID=2545761 RepID=A0A4R4E2C6_9BACT|nr:hypothetical protein [Flaviaesturariibacter aridisoli]TCZ73664.1 hypothetical protein E0486_05115 [Flaviaesturariibacter aridisoli]